MSHHCPTCGADWIPPPITVDLRTNTAYFHGRPAKLEPMEAEILFTVLKCHPQPTGREKIGHALYGHGDWPATWENALAVRLAHLRRIMSCFGYTISHARERGYVLIVAGAGEIVQAHAAARVLPN
jgi:DNA-binding response OmpR family regulator